MTKREAAEKWVGQFNAVSTDMIKALWLHAGSYEGDGWNELTTPRVGDYVYRSQTGESGEITHVYTDGEKEVDVQLSGNETDTWAIDEIEVERDSVLPMWGSMWSFGERLDDWWMEDQGGLEKMSACGFRIYEHEDFGYFFGIDGAGYDFYEQHWIPLYEARGLQWHSERDTISVLVVEPEKAPYTAEIGTTLEDKQAVVGGTIQAIYPYEDKVALVCHDEGKMIGLPLNRALYDEQGEMYDIVAGTFFICGLGEENFCSLTPEQADKFTTMFREPEVFARINGKLQAIKVPKDIMNETAKPAPNIGQDAR